ncbi:hypothetical protein CH380_01915 [Leptospira adleri]|uniref:Uncharacterized protein n=1 Tax=Leptospira adleri TaxID=2023186 RepID=A0A2M9YUS2_9LEPT|nr:hypothetical protein CH380_01915 [Leptospira adleri]PJZ62446.1 hypothetical protein CH376_08080 [Leptospira adleri]
MITFENRKAFQGRFVVPPTFRRETRAPHPDWVEEAGWRGKRDEQSSNTKSRFFQGKFSLKIPVVPPTKPSPKERKFS